MRQCRRQYNVSGRMVKDSGRNGRGRKRSWRDLRYYSDHLHRVTKDSMKSIGFDRGISQLQMMEHYSLSHHDLYQNHDYQDY
jgi:hypothetical protein